MAANWVCDLDAMTIRAVAQDDFSDVQIPDAPVQPPHTPNAGAERVAEPVDRR